MTYYSQGGQQRPRPNKRECLQQVFTEIRNHPSTKTSAKIQYITFGGPDFADLQDLAGVFKGRIRVSSVVSFENDQRVVELAKDSPVANLLKTVGIKIKVVPNSFPDGLDQTKRAQSCQRLFFLDYFDMFNEDKASQITNLLDEGAIVPGDWLIITSALDGRVIRSSGFISKHSNRCQLFYHRPKLTADFIMRNFVDALMKLSIDMHLKTQPADYCIMATLVAKYYYVDTTPMGVWCFRIEKCLGASKVEYLQDKEFTRVRVNTRQQGRGSGKKKAAGGPNGRPNLLGGLLAYVAVALNAS